MLDNSLDAGSKILWEAISYNAYGALTQESLGNGLTINKGYDDYGNLTAKGSITDYNYATYTNGSSCSGYHTAPSPLAVREANGFVFCYDEFGNQLSDGARTVTYNTINKPTQVTTKVAPPSTTSTGLMMGVSISVKMKMVSYLR